MPPSPTRKRLDRYERLLELGGDERVVKALDALVRLLVKGRRRSSRQTAGDRLLRSPPQRRTRLRDRRHT
jgi:hypothetical protein